MLVRRMSIACALASAVLGCSDDPRERMRQRSETAELAHLQRVKDFLESDAPRRSDLHVFLSKSVIDQALRQVVPLELPIREFGDAALIVREVLTAFGNGHPRLEMQASIRSPSRGVEVDVSASALLVLDAGATTPDTATLRVLIQDIAPSVAEGRFSHLTQAQGLWKGIANLLLADGLGELPAFTVPLAATIPISAGGPTTVTLPTGNGSSVTGQLTLPRISLTIRPLLSGAVVLEDGLHFFFKTEIQ